MVLKCPKCGYPRAKFIDKKFEDIIETRERRSRTGTSFTSTITKKKAIYKRGICSKCKHSWEEDEK